ncbi:hypothetical protein EMCRGX_G030915 [Ephydatia muelleri]
MFGRTLSVISGLLAALASVSSKLALEEGGKTIASGLACIIPSDYDYSILLLVLRIICFILMMCRRQSRPQLRIVLQIYFSPAGCPRECSVRRNPVPPMVGGRVANRDGPRHHS